MKRFFAALAALVALAIILFGVTLATVYVAGNFARSTTTKTDRAILRAAPGNTVVQMFDTLSDGPNVKVTTFPDGWGCTKLGGLITSGGMSFYKLDCGNRTGYVNADWVR